MRVGLVGAGRIGAVHFGSVMRDERATGVVVHDVDHGRASELAAAAAGRAVVVSTIEDVLQEVDALVIASPTPTHPPLLRAAIARGLPTFCEKPVAARSVEVEAISAEAAAAGAVVQVGFHYRFDPALRELAQDPMPGSGRQLRIHSTTEFAPTADYLASAGGLVADKLIHELDYARWMTPSVPVRVSALGPGGADAMHAVLLVQFADGTIATITGGYESAAGFDLTVELETREGVVVLGNRRPLSEGPVRVPVSTVTDFRDRFRDAYRAEISTFLGVAAGEVQSPCPLEEAARTQRLVDACTEALTSGRVVDMHSATNPPPALMS